MDIDFKMGWNDNGDWYNYTRDFPEDAAYYNVIGRFSSGRCCPVDSKLSIVTSDSTEEGQGDWKRPMWVRSRGPTYCVLGLFRILSAERRWRESWLP